uniref:DUF2179 domain-containing protein n=1 Tax=Desulfatirhabdium butyrativorans TaxID=340467 RepID=A0A7C4MQL8_9BACT
MIESLSALWGSSDIPIFVTGLMIFFARICDVSFGTIRTIVTVQGKTVLAFVLGFFEVIIWISIVSTVVWRIKESPILVLFYASGYATGNVVGILVERKLALGMTVIRIISTVLGNQIADRLRSLGQPVTTFIGHGLKGDVIELFIVCRRRDQKWILDIARSIDPTAFYTSEIARDVGTFFIPMRNRTESWLDRFKKK